MSNTAYTLTGHSFNVPYGWNMENSLLVAMIAAPYSTWEFDTLQLCATYSADETEFIINIKTNVTQDYNVNVIFVQK